MNRARALLIAAMLCLGLASATAEVKASIAEWLATPIAAPYSSIGAELLDLGARARSLGVPERLLVERLDEGALKRVPPQQLAMVIAQDVGRFATILTMIVPDGARPGDHAALSSLLRQGAIMLRAGFQDSELASIFAKARSEAAGRNKTRSSMDIAARALNAAAVSLDASIRFGLSPASRLSLGEALAASILPELRFEAVLSMLTRARGLGLQPDATVAILANGLEKGASIDALDREISRRAAR